MIGGFGGVDLCFALLGFDLDWPWIACCLD